MPAVPVRTDQMPRQQAAQVAMRVRVVPAGQVVLAVPVVMPGTGERCSSSVVPGGTGTAEQAARAATPARQVKAATVVTVR